MVQNVLPGVVVDVIVVVVVVVGRYGSEEYLRRRDRSDARLMPVHGSERVTQNHKHHEQYRAQGTAIEATATRVGFRRSSS